MCSYPEIVIKNTGSATLTSLDIKYSVNGGTTETHSWTGSLGFLETEVVTIIPSPIFWRATVSANTDAVFEAWVENPNGTADEYSFNDKMVSDFIVPDTLPQIFVVRYKGNNAPNESAWYIYDEAGNVIYSNTSWTTSYVTDTVSLDPGCYRLYVSDSDDDGLSWWANNDGAGDIKIAKHDWFGYYKTFNLDFGDNINWYFTVDYEEITSITEHTTKSGLLIYPNPSNGQFNIEMRGFTDDITLTVISLLGQEVESLTISKSNQLYNTIQLSNIKSGIYFVHATDGNTQQVKRIVIK